MNYFNRALVSVRKQFTKSIILLLIVMVLGVVMLSSLLVMQSVEANKKNVLKSLPPTVSLVEDFKIYDDPEVDVDELYKTRQFVTSDILAEIAKAAGDLIVAYDFSTTAQINVKSELKQFSFEENDESFYFNDPNLGAYSGYLSLRGVQNSEFDYLSTSKAKLIEGRSFTNEELKDGSYVVLISKEYAEKNGLTIGSIISSKVFVYDYGMDEAIPYQDIGAVAGNQPTIVSEESFDFEVIGILEYNNPPTQQEIKNFSEKRFVYEYQVNTPITPNATTKKINKLTYIEPPADADYNWPEEWLTEITFTLKDPGKAAEFAEIARGIFDDPFMEFKTQEEFYNAVAGPLNDIKGTMGLTFILSVGASVLVLSLVLIGFAKDRKKEIGIYLALGEKKNRIVSQLMIESIIVTLIGASIALLIGFVLTGTISSKFIPTTITDEAMQMYSSIDSLKYETIVENYQIGLSLFVIVGFYGTILIATVAAQLVSLLYTLRLDPKKIMM